MVGRRSRAVTGNTMSKWREIEKIPAKLGHAIATLAQKNGIPRRAFGVCPQALRRSRATGAPPKTARVIRGPPEASIWGRGFSGLARGEERNAVEEREEEVNGGDEAEATRTPQVTGQVRRRGARRRQRRYQPLQ